jgi:hypothetical protein
MNTNEESQRREHFPSQDSNFVKACEACEPEPWTISEIISILDPGNNMQHVDFFMKDFFLHFHFVQLSGLQILTERHNLPKVACAAVTTALL